MDLLATQRFDFLVRRSHLDPLTARMSNLNLQRVSLPGNLPNSDLSNTGNPPLVCLSHALEKTKYYHGCHTLAVRAECQLYYPTDTD